MTAVILTALISGFGSAWATWRWQRASLRRERRRETWIEWLQFATRAVALLRSRDGRQSASHLASLHMATTALCLVEYDTKLATAARNLMIDCFDLASYLSDGMPEEQLDDEVRTLSENLLTLEDQVRNALDDRDALDRALALDTRDHPELGK